MKNEHQMSLAEALRDTDRVEYFEGYANAMLQAVTEDGVPVKGYFGWSEYQICGNLLLWCTSRFVCLIGLLDNFEWYVS